MKFYSNGLINNKRKRSFKSIFVSGTAPDNHYYGAKHHTEEIYLLWIESVRFGKCFCFPCVLDEAGDPLVYFTGGDAEDKRRNGMLIQRWNLFVNPENIQTDYNVEELEPTDFQSKYDQYKKFFRQRQQEGIGAEAELLPDAKELPEETDAE